MVSLRDNQHAFYRVLIISLSLQPFFPVDKKQMYDSSSLGRSLRAGGTGPLSKRTTVTVLSPSVKTPEEINKSLLVTRE